MGKSANRGDPAIVEKTDGGPIVCGGTDESHLLSQDSSQPSMAYALTGTLSAVSHSATLQDSLMARLDHLMTSKVLPSGFSYWTPICVWFCSQRSHNWRSHLHRELGRLVEAEIVYQRGLTPPIDLRVQTRLNTGRSVSITLENTRQQYHQRIAQVCLRNS